MSNLYPFQRIQIPVIDNQNNFDLFLTVLFEAKVIQKLSLNGMIDGYRFIYMITRGYTYVRVR